MSKTRSLVAIIVASATIVLGGCSFAGVSNVGFAGLNVGSSRLLTGQCMLPDLGFGLGGLNAAAVAGARMQQAARYQARFSLMAGEVRAQRAQWKWLAEGPC